MTKIDKVLACNQCGMEQIIWRRKARNRAQGHVKHLWCVHCQERTPHTEKGDA